MIIAVNISKALAKGLTVPAATERAWALNRSNCKKREYVIGVVNGLIKGYFKLDDVKPDAQFPNRVKFYIKLCSNEAEQFIGNYIRDNNINLTRIQRGKYI